MKCQTLFSGTNQNKSTASGAIYACSPLIIWTTFKWELLIALLKGGVKTVTSKQYARASINFQTQEVPDFLPLKFGSPTGKSRKSHFFFRAAAVCPFFSRT